MLLLFFIAFTFLTLIPASCLDWGATLVNAAMYLRSYSDSYNSTDVGDIKSFGREPFGIFELG